MCRRRIRAVADLARGNKAVLTYERSVEQQEAYRVQAAKVALGGADRSTECRWNRKNTEDKDVWRDIGDGGKRHPELIWIYNWTGGVVHPLGMEWVYAVFCADDRYDDACMLVWAGDAGSSFDAGISADRSYHWLPGAGALRRIVDCSCILPLQVPGKTQTGSPYGHRRCGYS